MDLKEGRKEQGASTLSQQLARNLWLDQEKRWTRKMAELLVPTAPGADAYRSNIESLKTTPARSTCGRREKAFSINGLFGEAAEAYFGKDIRQLNLPESAYSGGHDPAARLLQSLPQSGPRARPPQHRALPYAPE